MTDISKTVTEYAKRAEVSENTSTNIDLTLVEKYVSNIRKVGKVDNDPKQTDLSVLKDPKKALELADNITDDLESEVLSFYGLKEKREDFDDAGIALLTKGAYGFSRDDLRVIAVTEKDKFTFQRFLEEYLPKFTAPIKQTLAGVASQNLTEEHKEDIVEFTGINKYEVDPTLLTLEQAKNYLEMYRKLGMISPKSIPDSIKKRDKVIQADFTPADDEAEEAA